MFTESKVSKDTAAYFNLVIVYLVWGSTYLAIRIGIQPGSGFTPFIYASSRVLTAGSILIIWALIKRYRWHLGKKNMVVLAISGLLLWVGGNGMVVVAETRIASGLASLIIAATPLWVTIIEALIDQQLPKFQALASLLIGFFGILILTYPTLQAGIEADILSIIYLLLAGFSWGLGSVIQSRHIKNINPVVSSGYQQLFGGLGLLIMALILHETVPHPSTEAAVSWIYLVVFGSIIAFTSFVKVLEQLPTKLVMTYAYVNPVVALILGHIILSEEVTFTSIVGAGFVIIGVSGVFRNRFALS